MTDEPRPAYPLALAFRRYLTTRPYEDLAAAAGQLSAELAAKNVALALARGGEPREAQPAVCYERETDFRGDFSELSVSFPDHQTLGFFTAELGEAAWEAKLLWLPDEDPPDVVKINRTDDGLPADLDAARTAMRGVWGYPLVLKEIEPDDPGQEGGFATWLPEGFPTSQVTYLETEDWAVKVLSRGGLPYHEGGRS